jgi:hypothetical protein
MTAQDIRDAVAAWCAGRSWPWRAPILLWLGWIGLRHLADPLYDSLFGALNLGLHEAGHLVFSWLPGQFLAVAGGTLLQLAAPVMAAVMFMRQPDYFAVPVCGAWLGMNLYNVAAYMADARAQVLPLVTVGDGDCVVCHDWAYMLDAVGLLRLDTALAFLVRVLAFVTMWASVAIGAWMLHRMAVDRAPA